MKASVRNTRKQGRHHVEVELELTPAEIAYLLEHGKLRTTPVGKTVTIKEADRNEPPKFEPDYPVGWKEYVKELNLKYKYYKGYDGI